MALLAMHYSTPVNVPVSTIMTIMCKLKELHSNIKQPQTGASYKISDWGVRTLARKAVQELITFYSKNSRKS